MTLPYRAAGPICHLRTFAGCLAFVSGTAWVVLSLLAIPRAIWFLGHLRRPEASWRHFGSGLTTLLLACFPLALLVAGFMMLRMPDLHSKVAVQPLTAEQQRLREALKADVQALAGEIGPRNAAGNYAALCQAAAYIETAFSNAGYQVQRQGYEIETLQDRPCYNLEVEIRGAAKPDEIVVIGAHYDSAGITPGANDNASGVAAVLALARAFAGAKPERTLRFVAFVNEEPPFFWSGAMGSLVYARRCRARHEQIVAMLCLETMGYYSDEPGSQRYPVPLFSRIYPTTGNFLGFIGNLRSKTLVRNALRSFRRANLCPAEGAFLPQWVSGVSLSDQWSFWHEGYPAVMVTDTAPYRYRWYHTPEDTPEKLNYDRFALAVAGLNNVVADLCGAIAVQDNQPRIEKENQI
jgi:hypothetical protein